MAWNRLLENWHALMEMFRHPGSSLRAASDRRQRRREQLVQQLEELARAELRRDHALPAPEPARTADAPRDDSTGWQS